MTRSPRAQTLPAELTLRDPAGAPVLFAGPPPGRLRVVQLVRYFGCLPCQDWLVDLDRLDDELEQRGADAVAVGGSADYQARWLHDERGVSMQLLLDPDHDFRSAVEMDRPLGWRLLNPRGLKAYGRSLKRGFTPQKITRDTVRSPGVVIIDSSRRVVWRHEGIRIGDYPDHAQVLAALDDLTASPR